MVYKVTLSHVQRNLSIRGALLEDFEIVNHFDVFSVFHKIDTQRHTRAQRFTGTGIRYHTFTARFCTGCCLLARLISQESFFDGNEAFFVDFVF